MSIPITLLDFNIKGNIKPPKCYNIPCYRCGDLLHIKEETFKNISINSNIPTEINLYCTSCGFEGKTNLFFNMTAKIDELEDINEKDYNHEIRWP